MIEIKGTYSATVTLCDSDGAYDLGAMRKVVQHQLEAGLDGFYLCGGTGEGMLLTVEERKAVLETVMDEVNGRAGIIVHVGAFRTAETLELVRPASEAGVDAIASLPTAYFHKPDRLALVRFYTALNDAASVPILIYNIPQRTEITMTQDLFDELLQLEYVVGMKDASGNIFSLGLFFTEDKKPIILEGEDTVVLSALLAGARVGIGLTYNLWPHHFSTLWKQFRAKDFEAAAKTQAHINEPIDALLQTDMFGGIKQVMAWIDLDSGAPRSPNRLLTEGETVKLRENLERVVFFEEVQA